MTPLLTTLVFIAAQSGQSWSVATGEGTQVTQTLPSFDFGKLVAIRRADKPMPEWPTGPHVILANDDRIAGKLVAADERFLTFENKILGKVRVPITSVAVIWRSPLPAGTPLDPMTSEWLGERKTDAVRLSNGDVLRGTVERFGEDTSVWLKQPTVATRKLDLDKTVAVGFSAGLSRVRIPKVPHASIVLSDGSRITIDAIVSKEGTLGISSITGFPAYLPETEMVAFTVLNGKATYLNELKPKRIKSEPYLSMTWPHKLNRSSKGNPLRVDTKTGIQTFDRGLGTHAKTTLEYDLAGKYRRFEAVVGLDATTSRKGRVPVRILVDGKPQMIEALNELRAELGPIEISVEVSNAKSLTLVVDFGPEGDASSDMNWCEARLIKD